jgi:hypothetical protein
MKAYIVLSLAAILVAVISCGVERDNPVQSTNWESDLANSPEVQELIAMWDQIEVSLYGLPVEEVLGALQNPTKAAELTGYYDWQERVTRISTSLYKKFPQLHEYESTAVPCGPEESVRIAMQLCSEKGTFPLLASNRSPKPVTCSWGPYTVSLVLCTAFGPGGYWACAYVATCRFCEGGWVDSICN